MVWRRPACSGLIPYLGQLWVQILLITWSVCSILGLSDMGISRGLEILDCLVVCFVLSPFSFSSISLSSPVRRDLFYFSLLSYKLKLGAASASDELSPGQKCNHKTRDQPLWNQLTVTAAPGNFHSALMHFLPLRVSLGWCNYIKDL